MRTPERDDAKSAAILRRIAALRQSVSFGTRKELPLWCARGSIRSPESAMIETELHTPDIVDIDQHPEAVLALIRQRADAARTAARLDLFKACAVLSMREQPSAYDFADAVARTLEQALGHRPEWHDPDEERMSFDESWLLRLVERSLACDTASVAFLISSRVPRGKRASVAYLVNGLAERLEAA
jgi:hypothetical protein